VKLTGDSAARFARRPDPKTVAALIHGPDPGQLAMLRRDLVGAVTGGDADRLTRMEPDAVRRDPAALADALRARSFFPGRRVVLVEGATGALTDALATALDGLRADDAMLVATATGIAAKSALVRLFETAGERAVLAVYPDQRSDPVDLLAAAGATARPTPEAAALLDEIAAVLDAGSMRQFCATLALYAAGSDRLAAEDVAALAPARPGGAEALVAAVAGGEAARVVPLVARLAAAGTTPQAMLSGASRQMRLIHRLLADPEGPRRAVARVVPNPKSPQRDRLLTLAAGWSLARAERAVALLHQAELALRAPGPRPERALAERGLLRAAMLAGR